MPPATTPRPGSRWWDFGVQAAVLGWAAFLALRLAPDDVDLLGDTLRDFIAARDCSAAARCTSLGPSSSYLLYHGFFWQRCLSWWMSLGLPLRILPSLVALFCAVGSWLLFRTASRLAGRGPALAAVAAYWLLAFDRHLADPLWSHGLVAPLINVFLWCAAAAFLAAGPRRAAAAVAAACVFSLANQAHTETLLFAPGIVLWSLLRARPGQRGKTALGLLGLALVVAAGWQVFSADSLRLNLGILASFLRPGRSPALPQRLYSFQPGDALRFCPWAAAFIASIWLLRRRRDRQPCDGFLAWAAGSYLLGLLPVLFGHETPWHYYLPLLPLLCLLGARALQEPLRRVPRAAGAAAAALSLAAFLLVSPFAAERHDGLRLGEAASLSRALLQQGYDCQAAYRYLSGGQQAYVDLLFGMWLFAPCQRDVPVLGAAAPRAERPVLIAVPPGRPLPAGLLAYRPMRVAGRGQDFFLLQLPAYVRLDEFREVHGGIAAPAQGFGARNRGFRQRCWDPDTLISGLRDMLSPGTDTLQFPIRLPRGSEARSLFLPAVEGQPGAAGACAGRIVAVQGVEAEVSADRRVLELRPSAHARQGTVTITWPLNEQRCFPGPSTRYPLPMLELPSGAFAQLRDVLP
jgi:hypothetical protein